MKSDMIREEHYFAKFLEWISTWNKSFFVVLIGLLIMFSVLPKEAYEWVHSLYKSDFDISVIYLNVMSISRFLLVTLLTGLVLFMINAKNNIFILQNNINKDNVDLTDKINSLDEKIKKLSNVVTREIVSINNKNLQYDSKIVKQLFKMEKDPANFLVQIGVGISSPIGDSIVADAFSLANDAEFAKACCMVNNKKYIEYYVQNEKSKVTDLLYYFYKQIEYTQSHLTINRIFSFPLKKGSAKKEIDFNETNSLILLMYIIFNYTSNVNTYLHFFDYSRCITEQKLFPCSQIDYVSLMWYKDKLFHYNAFITPSDNDVNLVVVDDNDIILHKFLEEDYTVHALAKPDTGVTRDHYCIKFKPSTYRIVLNHLGLFDKEKEINEKINNIIDKLTELNFMDESKPDFTYAAMKLRINSFFSQITAV